MRPTATDRKEMAEDAVLELAEKAVRLHHRGQVTMSIDLARALVGMARRGRMCPQKRLDPSS